MLNLHTTPNSPTVMRQVVRRELKTSNPRHTLAELLCRYSDEVTPTKKGALAERNRIRVLLSHPLCAVCASDLTLQDFKTYRDARLQNVSARTVSIELSLFSIVFKTAAREWGLSIDNPLAALARPAPPAPRNRRLSPEEESRLLAGARSSVCRAEYLEPCIILALETGMLAGEIVALCWEDISADYKELKTAGDSRDGTVGRTVPLGLKASAALKALADSRMTKSGRVSHFYDSSGMSRSFARACKRAGIDNLHFQDLRNEAAWRLASQLPVMQLLVHMGFQTLLTAQKFYATKDL